MWSPSKRWPQQIWHMSVFRNVEQTIAGQAIGPFCFKQWPQQIWHTSLNKRKGHLYSLLCTYLHKRNSRGILTRMTQLQVKTYFDEVVKQTNLKHACLFEVTLFTYFAGIVKRTNFEHACLWKVMSVQQNMTWCLCSTQYMTWCLCSTFSRTHLKYMYLCTTSSRVVGGKTFYHTL